MFDSMILKICNNHHRFCHEVFSSLKIREEHCKMGNKDVLNKLDENPKPVTDEAVRLLFKIAENIIQQPMCMRVRTLNKDNTIILEKILRVKGGSECLKSMGFEETLTCFILPLSTSALKIKEFRMEMVQWKSAKIKLASKQQASTARQTRRTRHRSPPIKRYNLPPLTLTHSNVFLRSIETYFHNALAYDIKELQDRARKLLPIRHLEEESQMKLRAVQEQIKKNHLPDPDLSIQDMMILNLLKWFKDDFFTWVDSPNCKKCGGKTRMSHMSSDPKHLTYTKRVELHRCDGCKSYTKFPRYNDLNILLETRKGRCGEWANTFTLFCRALGWDARFVVEENDHVWTEVYSVTQKRWLHCDPCENICDSPLVYETGWSKKISYVIAYSSEEVQDVTWRYSAKHQEVLTRRRNCTEQELLDSLLQLRTRRQKNLSETRRLYLTKRLLSELVELMVENKPNETDGIGRMSGSLAWKAARREIQDNQDEPIRYCWEIRDSDIVDNNVSIRYSTVADKYEYWSGGKKLSELAKWNMGTFSCHNVFRKVENDWNMVYLCRKDSIPSSIVWKFALQNEDKKIIDTVILRFDRSVFGNGKVRVYVCPDETLMEEWVSLPKDENELVTKQLSGEGIIYVVATLNEGDGDLAWQHTQLFRQKLDSTEYPFNINLIFRDLA